MEKAPITVSNRFLKLIAHHIFGDSPVTVMREMVQNAHDAVLMRSAAENAPEDGWGVQIDVDEQKRKITVVDTGVGMGPDDIVDSLTRLGAGAKEEDSIEKLRSEVANPEMLKNVAGVFGFGFVAAMMVSRVVEIWTRKKGGKPLYCKFDEGEEEGFYEECSESDAPEVGTRVMLHVDPDRSRIDDDLVPAAKGGNLLNVETMTKILQKYCDLLEFEVVLSSSGGPQSPVNLRQAPWERATRPGSKEMLQYFQRRFGERLNEPLVHIPINFTQETHDIEASGVLYVPRPATASTREEGNLEIFVKRIWICDDDLGILPEWAKFLRGVIVSPDLAVAIDRCGLDTLDRGYHDLKIAMRDRLRAFLVDLASKQRETFQELLDAHGEWFRRGLLNERVRYEGARPVWFTDLARTIPFRVFSKRNPGGCLSSVNELLDLDPETPILLPEDGEKHRLHGVNRVVPFNQQSEFRKVIADKNFAIIVPEADIDLFYLQAIGKDFEDVLTIENVEYRFGDYFVDPISAEEQDRWQPFVHYIEELLRYKDTGAGVVNAGGIRGTELPALIHFRDRHDPQPQDEDAEPRARFSQITTINTSNSLMQDLLKYVEERNIRSIQFNSLVGICLHASYHLALLDQNANLRPEAFQDIVQRTCDLMDKCMASAREADNLRDGLDELQANLAERAKEIERLQAAPQPVVAEPRVRVPKQPEERMAAIVFVDLVGSTQALADLDFAELAELFDKYVQALKKEIEDCDGFFDKFTGDGVIALFGVEDKDVSSEDASGRAMRFAERALLVTREFGDRDDVRPLLQTLIPGRPGLGAFRCRVAVSYGKIAFGGFGGAGSAVGKKMIQAARICSDKALYGGETSGGLIITRDIWHPIGAADEFKCVEEHYQPRGLAHTVSLYQPQ